MAKIVKETIHAKGIDIGIYTTCIFLCGSTAVPEERIPPIRRQETAVPEQGYRT